jgi:hypothetical protein
MLILRHLAIVLALAAGFAALRADSVPTAAAQTNGQPEEFNAIAIMNNNLGSASDRVIMRVERWSTEAERTRVAEALKKGNDAALNLLRELRPVGTIRTPDSVGYDLRYAAQEPADEGGRRIVLATDRPIGFWEARDQPRTIDYPFTFIQLEMDKHGEGKGTLSLMTKVLPRGNIIVLENFATAPVMLREVRSRPVSP